MWSWALGELQVVDSSLVINGHSKVSQILRIDPVFALGETADNGVWYSSVSLPGF